MHREYINILNKNNINNYFLIDKHTDDTMSKMH